MNIISKDKLKQLVYIKNIFKSIEQVIIDAAMANKISVTISDHGLNQCMDGHDIYLYDQQKAIIDAIRAAGYTFEITVDGLVIDLIDVYDAEEAL